MCAILAPRAQWTSQCWPAATKPRQDCGCPEVEPPQRRLAVRNGILRRKKNISYQMRATLVKFAEVATNSSIGKRGARHGMTQLGLAGRTAWEWPGVACLNRDVCTLDASVAGVGAWTSSNTQASQVLHPSTCRTRGQWCSEDVQAAEASKDRSQGRAPHYLRNSRKSPNRCDRSDHRHQLP
jgi:hypothetical protein